MGLDLRPLGKPKLGFENRFKEIFELITSGKARKNSLFDNLMRRKRPSEKELLDEWNKIQTPSYEIIKAPKVGRDKKADQWLLEEYQKLKPKVTLEDLTKEYEGYYVIELGVEDDGIPFYTSLGQDKNVFRGQLLTAYEDLIGKKLIDDLWKSKLADDTLKYGEELMRVADQLAKDHNLEYLKDQRSSPNDNEDSIDYKIHVIYSLAKWLIFYGSNGYGYEADY